MLYCGRGSEQFNLPARPGPAPMQCAASCKPPSPRSSCCASWLHHSMIGASGAQPVTAPGINVGNGITWQPCGRHDTSGEEILHHALIFSFMDPSQCHCCAAIQSTRPCITMLRLLNSWVAVAILSCNHFTFHDCLAPSMHNDGVLLLALPAYSQVPEA